MHSVGSTLQEDGKVVLGFARFLVGGGHISDHEVELNVRRELNFIRVHISLLVDQDGARSTVSIKTFLGIVFVIVEFLENERGNEFEESSLGSISFNFLVNPVFLILNF